MVVGLNHFGIVGDTFEILVSDFVHSLNLLYLSALVLKSSDLGFLDLNSFGLKCFVIAEWHENLSILV